MTENKRNNRVCGQKTGFPESALSEVCPRDARECGRCPKRITIPAVLKTDGNSVELLAKIDTGASDCLFERAYGEALGLRVEEGVRKTYSTANSRFEAYGHEIAIHVLGTETMTTAYFFADPIID